MKLKLNKLNLGRTMGLLALGTLAIAGFSQEGRGERINVGQEAAELKMVQFPGHAKMPKIVFFAGYGDLNQKFDSSSGSPDVSGSYANWPSGFPLSIPGQSAGSMDESGTNIRRNYNIKGYPAFNSSAVMEASFRADIYVPMDDSNDNDSIVFYSNSTNANIAGVTIGTSLTTKLANAGVKKGQWVSVVVDLTPKATGGGVYVYGIDSFGNPVPGQYFGGYAGIPLATQKAILQAASDGNLQGFVQDDTPCSYVELHVKAL